MSASPRVALGRAVALARLALQFGRVERVTRHEDGVRPETDTDHTVMLALVACDFAHAHNRSAYASGIMAVPLDVGRVAEFAIVHDLVEAYAGDTQTLTISAAGRASKDDRERAALERLRTELGPNSWPVRTIEEYGLQDTPEARYVKVLDKVLPKLTHCLNGCVAARGLTDRDGFERAHSDQWLSLRASHGDVAVEVFELLNDAIHASESAWGDAP